MTLGASGSGVTIKGNEFSNNGDSGIYYGVHYTGSGVLIIENTITNNPTAIVNPKSGSTIYHNNFIDNTSQSTNSLAVWDNGYPDGGNYWSNHTSPDVDDDGIVDVAYGYDSYPLVNQF